MAAMCYRSASLNPDKRPFNLVEVDGRISKLCVSPFVSEPRICDIGGAFSALFRGDLIPAWRHSFLYTVVV